LGRREDPELIEERLANGRELWPPLERKRPHLIKREDPEEKDLSQALPRT